MLDTFHSFSNARGVVLGQTVQVCCLLQCCQLYRNGMARISAPSREKTNKLGFRPGPTKTDCTLTENSSKLEISDLKEEERLNYQCSEKQRLICTFGLAYADGWFSHAAAHLITLLLNVYVKHQRKDVCMLDAYPCVIVGCPIHVFVCSYLSAHDHFLCNEKMYLYFCMFTRNECKFVHEFV